MKYNFFYQSLSWQKIPQYLLKRTFARNKCDWKIQNFRYQNPTTVAAEGNGTINVSLFSKVKEW